MQVSVGGFGGVGNDGGIVTVGNHGFINTSGDGSAGIKAQSIGGGGGSGGNGVEGTDGLFPGLVDVGVDKVLGLADEFLDTSGGKLSHLTLGAWWIWRRLGRWRHGQGDQRRIRSGRSGSLRKASFAQSIGGGGGDGGEVAALGEPGILSVGGFGGASGERRIGGDRQPVHWADRHVGQRRRTRSLRQSIGGGGGNGWQFGRRDHRHRRLRRRERRRRHREDHQRRLHRHHRRVLARRGRAEHRRRWRRARPAAAAPSACAKIAIGGGGGAFAAGGAVAVDNPRQHHDQRRRLGRHPRPVDWRRWRRCR